MPMFGAWPSTGLRMFGVLAALAWPRPGAAEGALAIGLPGDVAKDGVAIGWVINSDSEGTAQERALRVCNEFKDAPATTQHCAR